MRILLNTDELIDDDIQNISEHIWIFSINSNNIFDDWIIVLDKYSLIIEQLFYKEWVFINTIFWFLLKLKTEGESLYYRQLHTKLLLRIRELMYHNPDILIYTYNISCEMQEYLDVECFNYTIFDNKKDLIKAIKLNTL